MSRSATPRLQFDGSAAAASLKSAFQAELEAVHRAGPGAGPSRPQVYKPPQSQSSGGGAWASGGGGWAQPKTNGLMADGKDFAQTLAASLAKSKSTTTAEPKK
ncbi:hypothetical protein JCM16303_002269 [Sporobolomyces ruberrimus]